MGGAGRRKKAKLELSSVLPGLKLDALYDLWMEFKGPKIKLAIDRAMASTPPNYKWKKTPSVMMICKIIVMGMNNSAVLPLLTDTEKANRTRIIHSKLKISEPFETLFSNPKDDPKNHLKLARKYARQASEAAQIPGLVALSAQLEKISQSYTHIADALVSGENDSPYKKVFSLRIPDLIIDPEPPSKSVPFLSEVVGKVYKYLYGCLDPESLKLTRTYDGKPPKTLSFLNKMICSIFPKVSEKDAQIFFLKYS